MNEHSDYDPQDRIVTVIVTVVRHKSFHEFIRQINEHTFFQRDK